MPFVLALDQGTTSSRALCFDAQGKVTAVAQQAFEQHFPQPGWVEHDAHEILASQLAMARQALQGIPAAEVAALGLTNQRETVVLWERASGRALAPAIVWQDRRTAADCQALKDSGCEPWVRERSGLRLDPYFSASKIAWYLRAQPELRRRAEAGELAVGTIDSWLLWHLTEGRVHATDVTNASRTLLMNLQSGDWDDELLRLFGIPRALLPRILRSADDYGHTELFGGRIAIAGVAGDQQAALFGQGCTQAGQAKNTYGTGCFLLAHTGSQPLLSGHGLLSTRAAQTNATPQYALEGSVFMAGALVQWLRDGLGIIQTSAEIEALAASAPSSAGVVLVPAFTGLGAPHWAPDARGALLGLTRGSGKAHIARAALEAIAFQCADLLDAMAADGATLTELRVDGGATANALLMQLQADAAQLPVLRPAQQEATAWGAAALAGLQAGLWADVPVAGAAPCSFTPGEALSRSAWRRALQQVLYRP